jgi:hypothetical protein
MKTFKAMSQNENTSIVRAFPMDKPNHCFRQNIANIASKVLPMDELQIGQNRNLLQCQGIYA